MTLRQVSGEPAHGTTNESPLVEHTGIRNRTDTLAVQHPLEAPDQTPSAAISRDTRLLGRAAPVVHPRGHRPVQRSSKCDTIQTRVT